MYPFVSAVHAADILHMYLPIIYLTQANYYWIIENQSTGRQVSQMWTQLNDVYRALFITDNAFLKQQPSPKRRCHQTLVTLCTWQLRHYLRVLSFQGPLDPNGHLSMPAVEKILSCGTQPLAGGEKPRYTTLCTVCHSLGLLIKPVNHSDVVTETNTTSKNPDHRQEHEDKNGMFHCLDSTWKCSYK